MNDNKSENLSSEEGTMNVVINSANSSIISKQLHRYKGTDPVVIVPSTINKILTWAFKNNTYLREIYIEGSVEIEYGAFTECTALESVVFNKRSIKIDSTAFMNCSSLRSFALSEGISKIKNGVFEGCKALEKITIPSSVKVIGVEAFSGCTSLKHAILQEGLLEIRDSAFHGCVSLTGISIPNSVKRIGFGAFSDCKSLKNLFIPDSVEKLSKFFAKGATSLEVLAIPGCVKKVDNEYLTSDSLTAIQLGNGVESIEAFAFWGLDKLQAIIIPPSVKRIASDAFITLSAIKKFEPTLLMNMFAAKEMVEAKKGFKRVLDFISDKKNDEIKEYSEEYAHNMPDELLKSDKFIKDFNSEINNMITIYGVSGSTAEKYAVQNGFGFEDLENLYVT